MISASCEWSVQRTRVRNGYALWRCGEAGPAPWSTPGPRLFKLWSGRAIRGGSGRGAEGLPGLSARDAGDERRHSNSRMGFGQAQAIGSTSERPLRGEATFVERASLCRAPHELRYEVERPDEIQRAQGQRCVERERDGMPRDVTGRGTGYQLVTVAAAERETDPVGCLDRDGQWHADCNFRACRAACIDGC